MKNTKTDLEIEAVEELIEIVETYREMIVDLQYVNMEVVAENERLKQKNNNLIKENYQLKKRSPLEMLIKK